MPDPNLILYCNVERVPSLDTADGVSPRKLGFGLNLSPASTDAATDDISYLAPWKWNAISAVRVHFKPAAAGSTSEYCVAQESVTLLVATSFAFPKMIELTIAAGASQRMPAAVLGPDADRLSATVLFTNVEPALARPMRTPPYAETLEVPLSTMMSLVSV